MKIIYLHQYFNTLTDAGSTRSYEMGRRLVEYGHDVYVITSFRVNDTNHTTSWYETTEAGMKVYWLPIPYNNNMRYRHRIGAFIKFALKASIKAASLKADIVFASSTPLTIAIPAVFSAWKQKVPMVFEVRDLWPELPIAIGVLKNPLLIFIAKKLELFAYRNASRIIALSPGMKTGIVGVGYPGDKVEVIPNGCDIDFFRNGKEKSSEIRSTHDWLGQRPLVLYAGAVGLINNVEYMAYLAAETIKIAPEVRFVVIGDGKRLNLLLKVAKQAGVLNKNLFVLPKMAKDNMPEWLMAADIVTSLFTDLKEMWNNSANKFFDALAAGKPVAINYGGWHADLLSECGAGIVMRPTEYNKSAELLAKVISDKQWLKRAGEQSSKLALESFNRVDLAKKLENILVQVVGDSL